MQICAKNVIELNEKVMINVPLEVMLTQSRPLNAHQIIIRGFQVIEYDTVIL